MTGVPISLFVAALALPVGGLVWLHGEHADLEDRLHALEGDRAAYGPATPGEASDMGEARDGPSLGGSPPWKLAVEELRGEVTAALRGVREVRTEISRSAAEDAAGTVDAADPHFESAVRDVVMELAEDVRFRTRLGLSGAPGLGKKPPFHRLAEVLELDAVQEERLRTELVDMKQAFIALMSEERTDGIVPLERFAEADQLAENDPARAQIFIEMLSLNVPGSEETYLQRMMQSITGMRKRVRDHLRPQQVEIWDNLDIDWMGLEVE